MTATAAEIIAALEAESERYLVATTSFTAHVEGERQEVRAGVTHVIADHPLARIRPDAFAPERADSQRARAASRHSYRTGPAPSLGTKRAATVARKRQPTAASAPKPSRSGAWRGLVRTQALGNIDHGVGLREALPAKPRRVMLPERVREGIAESLRKSPGRETGGILLGHEPFSWHPAIRVCEAGEPGNLARRNAGSFGPDDFHDDDLERRYIRNYPGQVKLGYWHSHPESEPDVPSDFEDGQGDLGLFEAMREATGLNEFVALIVVPNADSWRAPQFTPWIMRANATITGRTVCERGVIE